MTFFERRRESKEEAREVDELLKPYQKDLELEKDDVKALIIAGLTTILPAAVIFMTLVWVLAAFVSGILR